MNNNERFAFLECVKDYFLDLRLFSLDVARFIACQSALESAFGSSDLAFYNRNYFGMKVPRKRINHVAGKNLGHASYYSKFDCFDDYVLWLAYNQFSNDELQNLDKFKAHLAKSGYCPASDYVQRIENLYQQYYSL